MQSYMCANLNKCTCKYSKNSQPNLLFMCTYIYWFMYQNVSLFAEATALCLRQVVLLCAQRVKLSAAQIKIWNSQALLLQPQREHYANLTLLKNFLLYLYVYFLTFVAWNVIFILDPAPRRCLVLMPAVVDETLFIVYIKLQHISSHILDLRNK